MSEAENTKLFIFDYRCETLNRWEALKVAKNVFETKFNQLWLLSTLQSRCHAEFLFHSPPAILPHTDDGWKIMAESFCWHFLWL